jgi:GH15 family glucan-1,4-alpha-glucosidase
MATELSKIKDYAIIGDGRSAALTSRHGAIDWLCWPRFDSPSIFAAILDKKTGGHWTIRPTETAQLSRRYIEKTNVLETTFVTASGKTVLTDFMAVTSEENKHRLLWPEHELLRSVRCETGAMALLLKFKPRLDYGRVTPKLRNMGNFGRRIEVGSEVFTLQCDLKLDRLKRSSLQESPEGWSATFVLNAGESAAFSLSFSAEAPGVIPPLGSFVDEKLRFTIEWWQKWAAQSNYRGPYERYVTRSALVLKLLSYAPSGAIVAAPTTSLPERLGGDLNWDYRFAWLRDAAFTVHTLFGLGYKDDAEAFVNWLLHATNLTRPRLQVSYDVFGERPASERELSHLRGHADSRPVRIGNAASEQSQLDIYGEVVEAVSHFFGEEKPDREMQKMLRQCGEYVCQHWREPDNGIWEERDRLRHYTHSRLMCWVTLDRLIEMQEHGRIEGVALEKCKTQRDAIRREIEAHSWNEKLGAYTQACGSEVMDASVLLLAYHGFEQASSPRMQATYQRMRDVLVPRPGLMHRNEQSRGRREGAFALCSFWETDFLIRSGRVEEAREIFESALSYVNDVDLFAELIDPESGDALGNFPQGFTHLGVINAALSLRDSDRADDKLER